MRIETRSKKLIETFDISNKYIATNERGEAIFVTESELAMKFAEYVAANWEFYDDTSDGAVYKSKWNDTTMSIKEIFEIFNANEL